jgi:hypothetical protein
MLSSL